MGQTFSCNDGPTHGLRLDDRKAEALVGAGEAHVVGPSVLLDELVISGIKPDKFH